MANPKLMKLKGTTNVNIYRQSDIAKVGYLSPGETYTEMGESFYNKKYYPMESFMKVASYTTIGWSASLGCDTRELYKHAKELAYGPQNAKYSISASQHVFETRRTIRIYSGTTLIDTIPSGSLIRTDGNSTAGYTQPDRLYITGYLRAGATIWRYFSSNTWAETGIKAGYYTWPSIKN